MKKYALLVTVLFSLIWVILGYAAVEVTLFGPEKYIKTAHRPTVYTDTFTIIGLSGTGRLKITNHGNKWWKRVRFAKIWLNGEIICKPHDFRGFPRSLVKDVNLQETNEIKVKLWGIHGKRLSIEVMKDVEADAAAVCGPGGCTVEGAGAKVEILNEALDEPTFISLRVVTKKDANAEDKLSFVSIEPSGLTLNVPAICTIPLKSHDVQDKDFIFAYHHSDANPINYGESENSQWVALTILSTTDEFIKVQVEHFSWLTAGFIEPLYTILHLPGKYLKKSDLIYTLTLQDNDDPDDFDWFPGHTGIYLGTETATDDLNVNDGETIIESIPGVVSMDSSFSFFRDANFHLYMGARRHVDGLSAQNREDIAKYAIGKEGFGYSWIGRGNYTDNKFSCVGLTEEAYDSAGKSIIPAALELPFILPIEQFNRTTPVNQITATVGELIQFSVRSILLEKVAYGADRYREIAASANGIREDLGMSFNSNVFNWVPFVTGEYIINFYSSGEFNDKDYLVYQPLRITIVGDSTHITGYWGDPEWSNKSLAEDDDWNTASTVSSPNKQLFASHPYDGSGNRSWRFKYSCGSGGQIISFQCYDYDASEWSTVHQDECFGVPPTTVTKALPGGCLNDPIELRVHSCWSNNYYEGYILSQ